MAKAHLTTQTIFFFFFYAQAHLNSPPFMNFLKKKDKYES